MKTQYNPPYLDDEERELMESIKAMKEEDIIHDPEAAKELQQAAIAYMQQQTVNMNIRVNPDELQKIKAQAAREGLKYQTFVKSVLHRYITGQLKPVG